MLQGGEHGVMAKIKTQRKPTYAEYAKQTGIPIAMVREYNRARDNWRRSAKKYAQATGANIDTLIGYGLPDIRTQAFKSGRQKVVDLNWVQAKIDQQMEYNRHAFEHIANKNRNYLSNAISQIEEWSEDIVVPDTIKNKLSKLTNKQTETAAQKLGSNKDFFQAVFESKDGEVTFNERKAKARYNKLAKYLNSL